MGKRNKEMTRLLVRDLNPKVVARLEVRARSYGRSLQEEAKAILEAAAPLPMEEAYQIALESQRRFAGRMTSDSAELLREDRDR
jgi:plasmid stability protein